MGKRIRLPLPQDFSPDPQDLPSRADLQEWLDNPMSALILARLRREAYRPRESSSESQWGYLRESLRAEGINAALTIIDRACNEVSSKSDEGDEQ